MSVGHDGVARLVPVLTFNEAATVTLLEGPEAGAEEEVAGVLLVEPPRAVQLYANAYKSIA